MPPCQLKDHRRALIGAALGVLAGMLLLGVLVAVARELYLGAVPGSVLPRGAAAAVYDTVVRFLRASVRTVAVVGLLVAAGAFLTGPSVTAARTRAGLVRGLGAVRGGAESAGVGTGRVGTWIHRFRRPLRIALVALAAATVTFWSSPTAASVLVVAVVLLVALGLVELLGRPPAVAAPSPEQPVTPGAPLP